jgi:PEGA domain-containing protein
MSRVNLSRVKLIIGTAVIGLALAGCSAMPSWMTPDFMSSKPSSDMQPLRFESDPPGADVRTTGGQTCLTPCAIPVPAEPQSVTITKIGFVPQTVQVSVGDVPEHSFWESAPPPAMVPNPVQVVLQPVAPPRGARRPPRPHHTVARAPRPPQHPAPRGSAPPPPGQPAPSAFPPPQQQGDPAFPPPPATGQ